ncbi:unnamed protein product [Hydatigera taeniaeformis]|uniref:Uncharacterized protein n=1 Tax=Hydatigena taeniaeformis TaxID=6205 RepID=A0A0R3WMZ4_HYDTA|nr:unnamed protein product [Hydatigera taeniaeformis]
MAYGPGSKNCNELIPKRPLFQSVDALMIKRDRNGQPLSHADAMKTRGKTYLSRSVSAYPPVKEKPASRKASLDSGSSTSRSDASDSETMRRLPPRRRSSKSQVRRTPPRNVSPNYSIDRMLASSPYIETDYPEAH